METGVNRKPRLLLVDDDEDLLLLMKMKMKAEGFVVQTSPNGDKVYDMVEQDRPDIVLLDITMRGISGAEICKHLKRDKTTKDIPVVLFSANYNIQNIADECGADGCIDKPFNNIVVREKLMNIIERHQA